MARRTEPDRNPIFVDDSGRRHRRVRWAAWSGGSTMLAFLGVVLAAILVTALGTPSGWRLPLPPQATAHVPPPTPTAGVPGPLATLEPQTTAAGSGGTTASGWPGTGTGTATAPRTPGTTKTPGRSTPPAPSPTTPPTVKPKPTHTSTPGGKASHKPTAPPGLVKKR